MEDGEGEEERVEGEGTGLGRGVDKRPAPAEVGEEEQDNVEGIGFGRGGCVSMEVGDEGVGDGVAEEKLVCFGGEQDGKKGVGEMCAAAGVDAEPVFPEITCGIAG